MAAPVWAAFMAAPVWAGDPIRLATYTVEFNRKGPGLLLRDILRGEASDIQWALDDIRAVDADILVLLGFDYDLGGAAMAAFAEALNDYPHQFARRPNSGWKTGLDMDGNGRLGEARDAQGYGRYAGASGMAVLSRFPIDEAAVLDFSTLLWRDLPGAQLPMVDGKPFPSPEVIEVQRLSTTAHWVVPVDTPGGRLNLFSYYATPPIFDGPEDRNGKRNADETRFWTLFLDGKLGPVPEDPFAILANSNLDPFDGDGLGQHMTDLLNHPRVQDPAQTSPGAAEFAGSGSNRTHGGPAAQDTADWPDDGVGNLRVDYVLPSAGVSVVDAGVHWPAGQAADSTPQGHSRHHIVWADVLLP